LPLRSCKYQSNQIFLLHFVASLFVKGVDNRKVGVDNRKRGVDNKKALELTNRIIS
jgi:hypothetical protein